MPESTIPDVSRTACPTPDGLWTPLVGPPRVVRDAVGAADHVRLGVLDTGLLVQSLSYLNLVYAVRQQDDRVTPAAPDRRALGQLRLVDLALDNDPLRGDVGRLAAPLTTPSTTRSVGTSTVAALLSLCPLV